MFQPWCSNGVGLKHAELNMRLPAAHAQASEFTHSFHYFIFIFLVSIKRCLHSLLLQDVWPLMSWNKRGPFMQSQSFGLFVNGSSGLLKLVSDATTVLRLFDIKNSFRSSSDQSTNTSLLVELCQGPPNPPNETENTDASIFSPCSTNIYSNLVLVG